MNNPKPLSQPEHSLNLEPQTTWLSPEAVELIMLQPWSMHGVQEDHQWPPVLKTVSEKQIEIREQN